MFYLTAEKEMIDKWRIGAYQFAISGDENENYKEIEKAIYLPKPYCYPPRFRSNFSLLH